MPDQLLFDIKQLVRVCLNDPDLRQEIAAALEEGPLPVRTPCANVTDGETVYGAIVKSDREKSPGDGGFLVRDGHGWLSARLSEIVKTSHDASTISAEEMAKKLGLDPAEIAAKLKG